MKNPFPIVSGNRSLFGDPHTPSIAIRVAITLRKFIFFPAGPRVLFLPRFSTTSTEIFRRVLFVRITGVGARPLARNRVSRKSRIHPFMYVSRVYAHLRMHRSSKIFLVSISGHGSLRRSGMGQRVATLGRDFQLRTSPVRVPGRIFRRIKRQNKRERGTIYCAIFAGENIRGTRRESSDFGGRPNPRAPRSFR